MSARDDLLDEYGRADTAPLGSLTDLRQKLAAVRAEVLRKAADAVNALPRDYECDPGRGDAAELLRRMADETGPAPAADPAPEFFQPGRTYAYGQTGYRAPELVTIFRVEHVTRHPDRGHLRAIGWSRTGEPGAGWHGDFYDQFSGWTDITDRSGAG